MQIFLVIIPEAIEYDNYLWRIYSVLGIKHNSDTSRLYTGMCKYCIILQNLNILGLGVYKEPTN